MERRPHAGFSSADAQRLCLPLVVDYEYHHQTVHVEAQQRNRDSLLSWMKRAIALRKRYRAFGRGTLEFRHPANRSVIAFIRQWQDEAILVVANLSRFDQYLELDLSGFEQAVPTELASRNPFRPVGAAPYPLTLAPHGFRTGSCGSRWSARQRTKFGAPCRSWHRTRGKPLLRAENGTLWKIGCLAICDHVRGSQKAGAASFRPR
jgi:hypothetical protein